MTQKLLGKVSSKDAIISLILITLIACNIIELGIVLSHPPCIISTASGFPSTWLEYDYENRRILIWMFTLYDNGTGVKQVIGNWSMGDCDCGWGLMG